MGKAEILAQLDELERLLDRGGWADADALRRFRELGFSLERAPGQSGYFCEKIEHAVGWADILFSARKHRRWDRGGTTGADLVAHFIRSDLAAARRNIEEG